MGKYFGTDGFRGLVGKELLSIHAYKIGRFLGSYLKKEKGKGRVLIGKDTRVSSDIFENAIASGIASSGADVYKLGVITTPAVFYLTREKGFDFGVMISASHNPFWDNGIKIMDGRGKIDEGLIEKIEEYIDNEESEIKTPSAKGDEVGKIADFVEGRKEYVDFLVSACECPLNGLKIGLDPSNGAGYSICQEVFSRLGADTYIINSEPNGININESCGSTHIDALCRFVKEKGLDMGFAYDGDGDRCIGVDENGEAIDGDKIIYALATDLKERGELTADTVVTTVMSNGGLYKALNKAGISHIETAVGDKYVSEMMINNGYSIGGEQSGHIIIGRYLETGDGILTSVKLAELVKKNSSAFSSLTSEVKPLPQILKNVHVSDKNAILSSKLVEKARLEAKNRLSAQGGRILLRPSGTEPLVRIMVEGESSDECEKIAKAVEKAILKAEKEVAKNER